MHTKDEIIWNDAELVGTHLACMHTKEGTLRQLGHGTRCQTLHGSSMMHAKEMEWMVWKSVGTSVACMYTEDGTLWQIDGTVHNHTHTKDEQCERRSEHMRLRAARKFESG